MITSALIAKPLPHSSAAMASESSEWDPMQLFPLMGVLFANALFFAPAPAVYRISRVGTLGGLNPLPLALMTVNTAIWFSYALIKKDVYLILSNAPGCSVSIWYVITVLPVIPRESVVHRTRMKAVVLVGLSSLILLGSVFGLGEFSHKAKTFCFGLFGCVACTLLFASPLSTAYEVVAKRDAGSIYTPLTIAQIINCTSWTVYGFIIGDLWVFGPNGMGTLLGIGQLALKLVFPSIRPVVGIMHPITPGGTPVQAMQPLVPGPNPGTDSEPLQKLPFERPADVRGSTIVSDEVVRALVDTATKGDDEIGVVHKTALSLERGDMDRTPTLLANDLVPLPLDTTTVQLDDAAQRLQAISEQEPVEVQAVQLGEDLTSRPQLDDSVKALQALVEQPKLQLDEAAQVLQETATPTKHEEPLNLDGLQNAIRAPEPRV
ncbi:hypothetical protein AB1Y20_008318 [Prymnesium parvum]|uniref:Sugar transporter SWEET1 n=1 Tax=Prymnesium parvum TaxID=97485 RepID=A0AB34IUC3_PRYPA